MQQRVRELEDNQDWSSDELYSPFAYVPNKLKKQERLEEEIKKSGSETAKFKSSPVQSQDQKDIEYASSDELMGMLKFGVNQKFKSFFDNWEDEVKLWKQMARKEVEKFSNYLNSQHQKLKSNLSHELSELTPVLNAKF